MAAQSTQLAEARVRLLSRTAVLAYRPVTRPTRREA